MIQQFVGKIPEDDLMAFEDKVARDYLIENEQHLGLEKGLEPHELWARKFPEASPLAIDLLSKLLAFNPKKRISVSEAIRHEYFQKIIALETPPVAQIKFNWEWEYKNVRLLNSIPFVKRLIYLESLFFHPEEPGEEVGTPQTPA